MKRRKVKTPDHWPSQAFHGKWDFIVKNRRKHDAILNKVFNSQSIIKAWMDALKPGKFPKLDES